MNFVKESSTNFQEKKSLGEKKEFLKVLKSLAKLDAGNPKNEFVWLCSDKFMTHFHAKRDRRNPANLSKRSLKPPKVIILELKVPKNLGEDEHPSDYTLKKIPRKIRLGHLAAIHVDEKNMQEARNILNKHKI